MGVLRKLKTALGIGTTRSRQSDTEPGQPETERTVSVESDHTETPPDQPPEPEPPEPPEPPETTTADVAAAEQAEPEPPAGEPVTTIKGVGPAYAERLEQAGISTVDDLLEADLSRVAKETEISETRLENWRAQAEAG